MGELGGFDRDTDQGQALTGIQSAFSGPRPRGGATRGLPDTAIFLPVVQGTQVVTGINSGAAIDNSGQIYIFRHGENWRRASEHEAELIRRASAPVFDIARNERVSYQEAVKLATDRMIADQERQGRSAGEQRGRIDDSTLGNPSTFSVPSLAPSADR